jgi:hypothetical protein
VKLISHLVDVKGWSLHAFEARFHSGMIVTLSPLPVWDEMIYESTDCNDYDISMRFEYLRYSDWIPVVVAPTLVEALGVLEKRLSMIITCNEDRSDQWTQAVIEAYGYFQDSRRDGTKENEIIPLSDDFRNGTFKEDK